MFLLSAGLEGGPNSNPGGEDLMTLEAEITELQRENARVESQMMRLKSDISAMESHLNHGDKVTKSNPYINYQSATADVRYTNPYKLISNEYGAQLSSVGDTSSISTQQQFERILREPEKQCHHTTRTCSSTWRRCTTRETRPREL